MKDCFLFNNSENENEENIFNLNSSFQNDESSNDFQSIGIYNPYPNNDTKNLDYNFFSLEQDNNINKDLFLEESNNNNKLFEEKNNNVNISESQSPLNSTKGTGDKNNNKIKIENKNINTNKNNNNIGKKRKQRIHLEDLNIDPEIIKYKKYQTIGDKVITSKNSKITDLDRKEIRAIRNRISAQKSRDRKKAEFNEMQLKIKFFEELTKKQNLIIQNFENISCPECKAKFMEIKLNISLEKKDSDKEYLVLDEDISFFSSDKKSSTLTKLTGALITLVCLICIVVCYTQGVFSTKNNIKNINNINQEINLRHLNQLNSESEETFEEINEENNNNILLPINDPLLEINHLQLYHDRFGTEINSYLRNKYKERNGFLIKKNNNIYNKTDISMCIETKKIEHNNYIIDTSSLNNTLPIEINNTNNNIVIDNNNLSHKIISLFVKDYNTLNRYINGRSLTLQEQIEIEAKNSEDGCVYLQMIIPNYDNEENKGMNSEYKNSFFEIRCKIFAYNNYYESKLATTNTY